MRATKVAGHPRPSLAVLLGLMLTAPAAGQPTPAFGPPGDCHDYPSRMLGATLRICEGIPWPAPTEQDVMPLLEANRERVRGKTVLDLGTGSGIIALHAARLGAAKVVATDIEPKAIACAQQNARTFGLQSIVETRLVSLKDPSAFSVIKPEEVFDVIVSAPPHEVNREPSLAAGAVADGIQPNDHIRLGLSIINGLGKHLSQDGAAILIYRSTVLHDLLVSYATHRGYLVEHHPTQTLVDSDWRVLYNDFAARVARTENIDAAALLLPPVTNPGSPGDPGDLSGPGGPGGPGAYTQIDYMTTTDGLFCRLWESNPHRVIPGMIVIRKRPTGPK